MRILRAMGSEMNDLMFLARRYLERNAKRHAVYGSEAEPGSSRSTPDIRTHSGALERDIPMAILPISPGWMVVYRGTDGCLRDGIVENADSTDHGCRVRLKGGTFLYGHAIRAVSHIESGKVVAGWTVRDCGLDGSKC